jgi:hypothetical protein
VEVWRPVGRVVWWVYRVEGCWADEWWAGCSAGRMPGGPAGGRHVGTASVGPASSGFAFLQGRGLAACGVEAWQMSAVLGPACSFSVSWHGEAFHRLWVKGAKVSALPGALPQPSMSPASQQGPSFTELTQSAAVSQWPVWILPSLIFFSGFFLALGIKSNGQIALSLCY